MVKTQRSESFAALFKKYRLRSEISTLSEFGELMAAEGLVYENSLYTHWQKGDRVPKDRKTLLAIIKIMISKNGLHSIDDANKLLEKIGQRDLTTEEIASLQQNINEIPFRAPIAGVGELIKSFRRQKNISVYELALSLGFAETSKIEAIEEGRVEKPSRQLIDRIFSSLKLQENEKNSVLLAGNYMPTRKEIIETRKAASTIVDNWPYSAVLYDFSWRLIMVNRNHARLLGMSEKNIRDMNASTPSAIEVVFDPNFMPNKYLKGEDLEIWHRNLLRFITHFRTLHKSITRQKWYIDLIKRMMSNELFRKTWRESQNVQLDLLVTRHGAKVFFDPKTNKKYKFNVFVVPLLNDPRFEIEFYTPADSQTFSYYQK